MTTDMVPTVRPPRRNRGPLKTELAVSLHEAELEIQRLKMQIRPCPLCRVWKAIRKDKAQ